jgi:hypothetical protein
MAGKELLKLVTLVVFVIVTFVAGFVMGSSSTDKAWKWDAIQRNVAHWEQNPEGIWEFQWGPRPQPRPKPASPATSP